MYGTVELVSELHNEDDNDTAMTSSAQMEMYGTVELVSELHNEDDMDTARTSSAQMDSFDFCGGSLLVCIERLDVYSYE